MRTIRLFKILVTLLALYSTQAIAGLWDPPPPPPPTPVNSAATITAPVTFSAFEGDTVTFDVLGMDVDGDAVTLSASNLPTGATFDAATGKFSWKTTCANLGLVDVSFAATDGINAPAIASTSINILDVEASDYYAKMIPRTQAEIKKLPISKLLILGWNLQLAETARLFSRNRDRAAMQMVDLVCREFSFVERKKAVALDNVSTMLCCEDEAENHHRSCWHRR